VFKGSQQNNFGLRDILCFTCAAHNVTKSCKLEKEKTMQLQKNPIYGHYETPNQLGSVEAGREYHQQFNDAKTVRLDDPRLAKVTRLRLLSDPGFPLWDVSYVHGILKDGSKVNIEWPIEMFKKTWKRDLIRWGKKHGVYVKGLGVFENISALM